MKNIMLTTAICAGSIVMTGLFVNNKMHECAQPREVKTIAFQETPKAAVANAVINENKIIRTSYVSNANTSFNFSLVNLKDDEIMSDEEINDDFMIEHLPVLNSTMQTDDEMNDLFQSENDDFKYKPNLLASDVEMNEHFQAENK